MLICEDKTANGTADAAGGWVGYLRWLGPHATSGGTARAQQSTDERTTPSTVGRFSALLVVWAAHIGGEHLREDDDLLARLGGQAVQPLVEQLDRRLEVELLAVLRAQVRLAQPSRSSRSVADATRVARSTTEYALAGVHACMRACGRLCDGGRYSVDRVIGAQPNAFELFGYSKAFPYSLVR